MAVKIRLTRLGRKNRPFYRIVVTDSHSPRDGRYIECIGLYNPVGHPPDIQVKEDRANHWLDCGAIPSETVHSLFQRQGILHKRFLKKRGLNETQIEEEMKKWDVLQIERHRREEKKAEEKKKKKAEEKTKIKSEDAKPVKAATETKIAEVEAETRETEESNAKSETAENAEKTAPKVKEKKSKNEASSEEKDLKKSEA